MLPGSISPGVEHSDLPERGAAAARVLRVDRPTVPRPGAATPTSGHAQEDEAPAHLPPGQGILHPLLELQTNLTNPALTFSWLKAAAILLTHMKTMLC